jgi:hypothetical protein
MEMRIKSSFLRRGEKLLMLILEQQCHFEELAKVLPV